MNQDYDMRCCLRTEKTHTLGFVFVSAKYYTGESDQPELRPRNGSRRPMHYRVQPVRSGLR